MAIPQHLLFLFVSLFLLPAALGTAIGSSDCHESSYDGVVKVTKVEINPYPIKFHDNPIFKITADTSQRLEDDTRLRIEFTSLEGIKTSYRNLLFSLCDLIKCPIEPGPFVLTLANVYAVQRNDHLSGGYNITIDVTKVNPSSAMPMCVSFEFHANALAEFINHPRTNGIGVSRVEIFPFNATVNDNPVFRITADTPENIPSSSIVSSTMVFEGGRELTRKSSSRAYNLCDSTYAYNCPVAPGPFVLTFPNPYWMYKIEAGKYRVHVRIIDPKFPLDPRMDLVFWFSVSAA